jgi:protein SCO1
MSPLLLRRTLQVLAGTLAGLAVVAVLFLGPPWAPGGGPGTMGPDPAVPEPYPAPPFSLVTAEGEPFDAEALAGQVSVVFFGFANCPDVCPITLANLGRALELLEPSGRAFRGVFVSVDPRRDTPEALRGYMGRFHPSLVALTGTEEAVAEAAEAWGVHVSFVEAGEAADVHGGHRPPDTEPSREDHGGGPGAPERGPGDGDHPEHAAADGQGSRVAPDDHRRHAAPDDPEPAYGVAHSTRSFVVDRNGRVVRTLAAYLTPEEIVEALEPFLR